MYPVAPWRGFQLSRIEFWVISATRKVVAGKVVGAPARPREFSTRTFYIPFHLTTAYVS